MTENDPFLELFGFYDGEPGKTDRELAEEEIADLVNLYVTHHIPDALQDVARRELCELVDLAVKRLGPLQEERA